MRHQKQIRRLGRTSAIRYALLRNLAESIILHGSIKTTAAKAKALRIFVEPLITKAKRNSVAVQREIRKTLYTDEAIHKLLNELGPKYATRPGGYTRTVKLATRGADAAAMVRIELV